MSNKTMYYSLRAGAIAAKVIPRNIGLTISYLFGYLYGFIPSKTTKKLVKIHKVISPNYDKKSLKRRARQVIGSYAQYWWDVFWLSTERSKKSINNIIGFEGKIYFDQAIEMANKSNVGLILALPHVGSWEIAGAWLAANGFKPYAVAERLNPPELFELFTKTRNDSGIEIIAHDDHPTSKLITAINEGGLVCLVADRDISRRGKSFPFFGKTKTFPLGPASLSIKTDAVILPVCMYLNHAKKIDITCYPPVIAKEYENSETITGHIVKIFEEMISKDPSQWHVLSYEWSDDE
ncbi:MAG: hypothetical protein U0R17_01245 [Acidimicrobiia bacterium]